MPAKSEPIDLQKAKRFKLVREYLKLNQVEMASDCRITQPQIARMEGGTRYISDEIVKILFTQHNVSPTYIIAGVGGIEYKIEKQTLIKDIRSLREDTEVLKAQVRMLTNFINEIKK